MNSLLAEAVGLGDDRVLARCIDCDDDVGQVHVMPPHQQGTGRLSGERIAGGGFG